VEEPLLCPEPFCGITKKTARRAIDLWDQGKARMAWKHTPGQRHVKKMINKSLNKLTSGLLILSRNQMRLVVGVVNRTLPPEKTPTQTKHIYRRTSL
jgi:hypothetical protein